MNAYDIFIIVCTAFFVLGAVKINQLRDERDDALRLLWDCRNKAHAWDKLFKMVKNGRDTVNVISGDELVMIQRSMSGSGYWIIMTNTSDLDIAGRTPEEAFEKFIRGRS